MFTGVVEEIGEVVTQTDLPEAMRLTIRGPLVTSDVANGDSIAVNGVCLTVVDAAVERGVFSADVMRETLLRSTFQKMHVGLAVNLERAVTPSSRLGGHIVQGHVDGTGSLLSRTRTDHWDEFWISLPSDLAPYVALKGSITIDGVSLTVSGLDVDDDGHRFQVSLIPTTLTATTLGSLEPGYPMNLEVDVVAKYLERIAVFGSISGPPPAPGGTA